MKSLTAAGILGMFVATVAATGCGDSGVHTLYRNSVVDPTMRIHVASFDTSDGEKYNAENCDLAATLFSKQPEVKVRFWCEPGTFKK